MSVSLTSSETCGADGAPDKAPEAISKAVASLPPEQMFELMKQMKHCIQNNPSEARNMLLQNPQLAYALLQAQVVMKIVDPTVALTMLHRPNSSVQPVLASGGADAQPSAPSAPPVVIANKSAQLPVPIPVPEQPVKAPPAASIPPPVGPPKAVVPSRPDEVIRGPLNSGAGHPFVDPRALQFEPRDPRSAHFDLRGGPGIRLPPMMRAPMMMPPQREMMRDPREMNRGDPRAMHHDMDIRPPHFDPRLRGMDPRSMRGPPPPEFDQRPMGHPMLRPRFPDRGVFDQRSPIYDQRDPRSQAIPHPGQLPPVRPMGIPRPGGPPPLPNAQSQAGQDQDKASLIMQVLQLSDQQIALLPPEQRQSIMVLKEQIARSTEGQK